MELEEVQNGKRKDVIMTIRTTRENSKWMKDNKISPSLLFDKALEELKERVEKEKHG
jgi:hypothetical protein